MSVDASERVDEEDKFYKEGLRIGSEKAEGRSHSRGPKKGTKAFSENNDCYYCKQSGHMKKNCFKYKESKRKRVVQELMELVPVGNNRIKPT